VISGDRLGAMSEFWQDYHGTSLATTQQVAQIATRAEPKTPVLYHVLFTGATAKEILAEVKREYDGDVVLADDLDLF
jgi:ribonuclease BN (tRNA processing enzyme)